MDWRVVKKVVDTLDMKKESSILNIGCGNSTLAEGLYDSGYEKIVSLDFIERVIEAMKKRSEEKRPGLAYHTLDVTDTSLPHKLQDMTFNLVLDKVSFYHQVAVGTAGERHKPRSLARGPLTMSLTHPRRSYAFARLRPGASPRPAARPPTRARIIFCAGDARCRRVRLERQGEREHALEQCERVLGAQGLLCSVLIRLPNRKTVLHRRVQDRL